MVMYAYVIQNLWAAQTYWFVLPYFGGGYKVAYYVYSCEFDAWKLNGFIVNIWLSTLFHQVKK